ncbi:hypothetical protein D6855_02960 [Butyrivibrio sp. CB08]|uniref:glycosyltransferase family 39 protein n=1 Tax=Butyrivibrio sp. CB08 TaxID=2364879 RepID=UPI000EA8AFC5|nr:glycosyltransferase family 39 protein [Butyrivibrio sp. CB08]RKM62392.1 hypothetical protein D6855_02960 [Butyrivibrio sp. CB08]
MNESLTYKTEKKIYDILPHEPETMAATLFIFGMAAYYFWRMFAITPSYDELYTYYTFISRGPVYAAIHWPLPNNHVGYSVLSAILNYTGNSFIGLRGVSFICAVSNLILIYRICKRYYAHGLAFGAMLLYASMQVVNEYSIQGRGYTLGTTCFLIAIYAAGNICNADETRNFYFWALGIAFVLALYTVPSSVYFVIPVSVAIGAYLLINAYRSRDMHGNMRETSYYKKFRRFFYTGLLAAFITVVLYSLIWLAIGSNLLVKTQGSEYYGLSHGTVLLRSPATSLLTGARYMLDQPYIQSLPRDEFYERVLGWNHSLYEYMLPGLALLIYIAVLVSIGVALYECVRHFAYSRTIINLMILSNIIITALILILQHKLPYLRVFSYAAVTITLSFCICIERLINVTIRIYNREVKGADEKAVHKEIETTIKGEKWYSGFGVYIPVMAAIVLFVLRFMTPNFTCQLDERENDLMGTLYVAGVEKRQNIAALDCDQQYLLKFGWDIDCQKTDVNDADCVIIDKNMMTPDYSGEDFWKFYQTYETIDWDYVKTLRAIYENERFILYVK